MSSDSYIGSSKTMVDSFAIRVYCWQVFRRRRRRRRRFRTADNV